MQGALVFVSFIRSGTMVVPRTWEPPDRTAGLRYPAPEDARWRLRARVK